MAADVSVIMPACQAGATIVRAVRSLAAQEGVRVELALCADDDVDYWALLPEEVRAGLDVALCRTPAPRSGPSAARNVALSMAQAPVIACLDADDAYAPGRLRSLLPVVERHGVATGPTREVDTHGQTTRTARPRNQGALLPVEDICELRMPFSPVFVRERCPLGFPRLEFAEDVILNVDLYSAAGAYAFVDAAQADYIYYQNPGSRTGSGDALERARAGYMQILQLVERRAWPEPVRALVQRVFQEDLAAVDHAAGADANWRAAVRDAHDGR